MLTAKQLTYYRMHQCLFKDISFELNEGDLLVIRGANGSGKSTLLNIIAHLISPSAGEIFWLGKKISEEYRESICYCGHKNGLKLNLSVNENLHFSQILNQTKSTYTEYLNEIGLLGYENQLARHLSAGQKRKLSLLKLFLSRKKIWIVDEPLTALDQAAQSYFFLHLQKHLDEGGIAIVSSHHPIASKYIQLSLSA